jgi:hypothetical protein
MIHDEINPKQPIIKSWYLEDELPGIDQPKKEDIQKACEQLNLPFTKETAMAIIYGDNQMLQERILPFWFNELK